MTRTAKKTIKNVSEAEANEAAKNYATSSNKLSKIEAKMNEQIDAIKAKYQDDITAHQTTMEESYNTLEVYAQANNESWGAKSTELLNCVIGFRTGTGSVKNEKGFTWDAVLKLLKSKKHFADFIRTKEEIDKKAILAVTDDKLLKKLEVEAHVTIVKEETFYVDVKKEELQPA
jgi:phage host-nuclease inhibitor protein Gam